MRRRPLRVADVIPWAVEAPRSVELPDFGKTYHLLRDCFNSGCYDKVTIDHNGKHIFAWPPTNRPVEKGEDPLHCIPLWAATEALKRSDKRHMLTRGDFVQCRERLVMGVYDRIPDWNSEEAQAALIQMKLLGKYDFPVVCPHGKVLENPLNPTVMETLNTCPRCFNGWNST